MSNSPRSTFQSDLLIAVVAVVAVWALAVYFNLFEPLHSVLHSYEHWPLDELLLALLSTSLVAFWFAYRRLQESLRESVRASHLASESLKYHDIVNQMKVGLLVYRLEVMADDRSLRLIDVNPAASEVAGFDVTQLVGELIDEAFPDIRKYALPERYANVVRSGIPFSIDEVEYGDHRIKASSFAVRAFALPEQCVGVTFENISERSRAESALRESGEHFKELVENIDEVFWIGAPDWSEVFYISPNYELLWGRFCESLYDNPMQWLDAVVDEEREAVREVIQQGVPMGVEEILFPEYRIQHTDGSIFWIRARAFPIRDENGDVIRIAGIAENITEQKDAGLLLQQTKERHEEAQHVARLGHWELDLIADKLIWSNETYFIFGDTPGHENTYETFLARVHPEDLDFVNTAYTGSVEYRTKYDIEHRLLMSDGSVKWVHEQCHTFYDQEGRALRSIGTTQDITDRKLADMKMIDTQNRLSGIIELAAEAIISVDEGGHILLFNHAAEDIFGYSIDEMMGHSINMLIPERFHHSHDQHLKHFADNGSSRMHKSLSNMFGLRRNGEEFAIEASISSQELVNQTVLTVMLRDVSERMKSETMLRKLSAAIGEAGEAVLITDRHAVIEYVNPAFTEITGYASEEVLGKMPSILKSQAQDPAFYKELWNTILAGNVWHGTLIDRRKDGSFYPALMNVAPIHDESGEITHFVSLQQDMTEHEKLEAKFMQAQKMEAIGTLVGGIAHDFNNMLAALQGNIYLAKQKIDDPAIVADKLDKVDKLSARAADMVHQLLTFARKDMVEMRAIHLNAFIKEGIKLACSAIPENIRVSREVSEQKILVKGDATQLQQVVMNLLNNARDAVADSQEPSIKTTLELYKVTAPFHQKYPDLKGDQLAHLSVQDSGCGIPSDLIDKVVEPFFTTKGVGKGTGLGLAMVYGAVKTHGGVLEIDSEEGQGTTVHIYLPLLQEQRSAERVDDQQAVSGLGQSVLLVDDDEVILETVAEVLRSLGYLVVEAGNGAEALEYYRQHPNEIVIVLTDMVMPVMGGVELIRQVRKLNGTIPVIMMTGYDFSSRGEEVEKFENFELLNKPVAIHELSQLMHTMMAAS